MKIPILGDNQSVVVFSDCKTGIILNLKGERYKSDDEPHYLVFESLEAAKQFAKAESKFNIDVEILVYNDKGEFEEMHAEGDVLKR